MFHQSAAACTTALPTAFCRARSPWVPAMYRYTWRLPVLHRQGAVRILAPHATHHRRDRGPRRHLLARRAGRQKPSHALAGVQCRGAGRIERPDRLKLAPTKPFLTKYSYRRGMVIASYQSYNHCGAFWVRRLRLRSVYRVSRPRSDQFIVIKLAVRRQQRSTRAVVLRRPLGRQGHGADPLAQVAGPQATWLELPQMRYRTRPSASASGCRLQCSAKRLRDTAGRTVH